MANLSDIALHVDSSKKLTKFRWFEKLVQFQFKKIGIWKKKITSIKVTGHNQYSFHNSFKVNQLIY